MQGHECRNECFEAGYHEGVGIPFRRLERLAACPIDAAWPAETDRHHWRREWTSTPGIVQRFDGFDSVIPGRVAP
jgi:hypothetical protein